MLQFADHQLLAAVFGVAQGPEQAQGIGFGGAGGEQHLRGAAEVPYEARTRLFQNVLRRRSEAVQRSGVAGRPGQ